MASRGYGTAELVVKGYCIEDASLMVRNMLGFSYTLGEIATFLVVKGYQRLLFRIVGYVY